MSTAFPIANQPTFPTIGQLATTEPWSVVVFQRHRIDFCCGGAKRLDEVAADLGLDPLALLAEIKAEAPTSPGDVARWDTSPLDALVDHILTRYHARLWEDLPRLAALADKVSRVHGGRDERLADLLELVLEIEAELSEHMRKEELVLFPWIKSGRGSSAQHPIQVMQAEHLEHGEKLLRLRELTGDFELPMGACASWTALWHGLERLESDLHEHIHLENNVLFPRALASSVPEGEAGTLDVRPLPPYQRHARIFSLFDNLAPGGSFVLVNDHDPRPVSGQLLMTRGPVFTWEYLEAGPEVWRVQITRK